MQGSVAVSLLLVACFIKMLLIPSYHSTDFEVHRNWLAITHSLPIKEWYFEKTSEWTLDYPPFFAYFEWMLSHAAKLVDPLMLQVDNLNHASESTVLFMRGSVIVTDIVLIAATWLYTSATKLTESQQMQVFMLVVFNGGLLLVDHVHFQYNGVMMGVLVLCIYLAQIQQYLLLAAAFSMLVLMKHLFVPLAPIFAVFLIQRHCFVQNSAGKTTFSVLRFLQMAAVAVTALAAAFGPFILQSNGAEQMLQIFARLFPFGRGLVHAYWAPNFWALYCVADKLALYIIKKVNHSALNVLLRSSAGVSSTSGIVGDFAFAVLPPVSAGTCMIVLMLSLVPALCVLYKTPSVRVLVQCLVYASLSSFIWGYHVHEKAVIIPMLMQVFVLFAPADAQSQAVPEANHTGSVGTAAVAQTPSKNKGKSKPGTASSTKQSVGSGHSSATAMDRCIVTTDAAEIHRAVFGLLVIAGTYSLFPLFYTLPELVTKALIFAAYTAGAWAVIFCADSKKTDRSIWLRRLLGVCLAAMLGVYLFAELAHPLLFYSPSTGELLLPFLPRMLTSVVCAVFLFLAWLLAAVALCRP